MKMVEGNISKMDTQMRRSISAEGRLAISLRFLATGRNSSAIMGAINFCGT